MNTTNEQDSNLNGDFQNSNLTNFSSKKFVRDYDKEPLIIKSYEGFFVKTLLRKSGVDCFAVSSLEEAITLREAGIKEEIVIFCLVQIGRAHV